MMNWTSLWLSAVFLKQIQHHGDNFSYIVADEETGEAAVVDSSFNSGEIMRVLERQNLILKYIINTHSHSDHTAGNEELCSLLGAKTVGHSSSRVDVDLMVEEGSVLHLGGVLIRIIHTPGHTPDSICLLVDKTKLLTGDTLFVGECGRTDLPGGNSRAMYDSLFNKLLKLEDSVEVYPGHDYGSKPYSTIGEERSSNYTLQPRSPTEFINFMKQP